MNKFNFKKSSFPKWLLYGFFAIGFSYSISTYFFKILLFTNTEKLLVLLSISFLVFSLLLLLPKTIFPFIKDLFFKQSLQKRILLLCITFGCSLVLFLIGLPYLPTNNDFKLTIQQDELNKNPNKLFEIYAITSVGNDGRDKKQIAPHALNLVGNWTIEKNSLSILSSGGESIEYKDYSNNGISLLLLRSPDSGEISVRWNGEDETINLRTDQSDQIIIDFPHSFTLYDMSAIRIIMIFSLLISNWISNLFLYFFLILIISKYSETGIRFNLLKLPQKLFFVVIFLTAVINLFVFAHYQSFDVFYLRRSSTNSLIALDNSSDDNFPYFQVYYNLAKNFNGYDFVVPKNVFTSGKLHTHPILKEERLLELGRISSVIQKEYNPELSEKQFVKISKMEKDTVPPIGVIPFDFQFIHDLNNRNDVLCMWWHKDSIIFIPKQNDFDCLKGIQ
jgi:hypothetical protein